MSSHVSVSTQYVCAEGIGAKDLDNDTIGSHVLRVHLGTHLKGSRGGLKQTGDGMYFAHVVRNLALQKSKQATGQLGDDLPSGFEACFCGTAT